MYIFVSNCCAVVGINTVKLCYTTNMDNIKREKAFDAAGIRAPDHPARSLLAILTALFRLPIKGTESDVFVPAGN
jgi:hypothetical protein